MAIFTALTVSQGRVVTAFRCAGNFKDLTVSCTLWPNLSMEELYKNWPLIMGKDIDKNLVPRFFDL